MMTPDFKKLAKEAAADTNKEFANRIAALTNINAKDLQKIIEQNNIDQKDFTKLIEVVKNKSLDNEQKAVAIQNINKGLETVVALVGKLI
jgi:predicted transcriptional regulator